MPKFTVTTALITAASPRSLTPTLPKCKPFGEGAFCMVEQVVGTRLVFPSTIIESSSILKPGATPCPNSPLPPP
jgi:hypothetical protein